MAILRVGVGQTFSTLASAVTAAQNGDTILLAPGTYTNDFATVAKSITIKGDGGMARLVATVPPPNGKAILVTRGDITIENIEFSGARVADRNGAGIRFEGGNLTVVNSAFRNNENGILAGSWANSSITVRNSEFERNGAGDGRSHGLYVGKITNLTVENSYFHDTQVGHHIKSRALATTVSNTRLQDETGSASYSVDVPNGGVVRLVDNVFEQGAGSRNPAIVHFGGEGAAYAGSSLTMIGNTATNTLVSPSARLLLNQTTVTAQISNTEVFGLATLTTGPAAVTGTVRLPAAPPLDTSSPIGVAAPPVVTPPPVVPPIELSLGTAGNDRVALSAAANGVVVDLGAGTDHLALSSAGPNTLSLRNVEQMTGGAFADSVTLLSPVIGGRFNGGGGVDRLALADAGNNVVVVLNFEWVAGGARADRIDGTASVVAMRLEGRGGDDALIGGAAADVLVGGAGRDTLVGNGGPDRFVFAAGDSSPAAPDRITDFQSRLDKLVFEGMLRGAFDWRGTAAFAPSGNSEARWDAAARLVLVDADGNGSADLAIRLEGTAVPTAGDFIWG